MEENKVKKEMTLDGLAELVTETRKALETKIGSVETKISSVEMKIDSVEESLATSTQKEFLKSREYMDKRFDEIGGDIKEMKADLNKKVDVFTHNDLKYRVEKTEEGLEKHKMMFHAAAKSNA